MFINNSDDKRSCFYINKAGRFFHIKWRNNLSTNNNEPSVNALHMEFSSDSVMVNNVIIPNNGRNPSWGGVGGHSCQSPRQFEYQGRYSQKVLARA